MTNPNYTHITMVVDRSGSMQSIRDASEDGVNEFISANKAAPGECTLLLREFDDRHSTVYGAGPIADFTTYRIDPRGMTAMLDAIVLAVNMTGAYLAAMKEDDRPGKVLFVVQTDGYENASTATWEAVANLIALHTDTYNWEFVFLGANIDAAKTASVLNILNHTQYTNTAASAGATYSTLTANTIAYRGGAGPMTMPRNVDAAGEVG